MKVIMPSTRCTCILMSRRQAAPECSPVALWSPSSTAVGIEAGLWLLDFDLSRCVDALWSIFFFLNIFVPFIYFVWRAGGSKCVHCGPRFEIRGQFAGVGTLFPPCGTQGLNSGCQVWWQALLPAEPPRWP